MKPVDVTIKAFLCEVEIGKIMLNVLPESFDSNSFKIITKYFPQTKYGKKFSGHMCSATEVSSSSNKNDIVSLYDLAKNVIVIDGIIKPCFLTINGSKILKNKLYLGSVYKF